MQAHHVTDMYGRRYRIGETDRELLGRPRSWTTWLTTTAMLVTGIGQYGFGALVPALSARWGLVEVCWAFALWTACQAGVAYPAARFRHVLGPARALPLGAVLSAIGLLALAHADTLPTLYLGYGLIGGLGAGLVYATCVGTAVRWFPDRTTSRISLVTAAFALGGVPFLPVAGHPAALDVAALLTLVVVTACGLPLRDPPPHWWPPDVDPRRRALTHRTNRPAIRPFAPAEALRSGTLAPLFLTVTAAAAVSLFDLVFLAVPGHLPTLAVLAAATALGRPAAGRLSDRIGRRRTLRLALATGGVAQLVILSGRDSLPILMVGAALAGLGTSCCYALLVNLVREYFGEDTAPLNFAVIYSAKAVGGVLGVGLASILVTHQGYAPAFLTAAALGLAGAALGGRLSHPGRPRGLLPSEAS